MMNNHTKDLHVLVIYILAVIGIFIIVLQNMEAMLINLLISLCWLFTFTVRNLFIYKTSRSSKYTLVTYAAEVLFLFCLNIWGAAGSAKLLFCITIADCYIAWNAKYATLFGIAIFSLYTSKFLVNQTFNIKNILFVIGGEAPVFMLVALISYLFGRVLQSNELVEKSMSAIQIREAELKEAYNEISRNYENLEEMASIKERNRIAREIHDTVGHTITTVIVEMEAGRMLAGKDTALAMKKFLMAQSQASKALDELRKSVRLLTNGVEQINLTQAVLNVVKETELHTGITVKSAINLPQLIKVETANLVIRILREGLANGIRHGGGTAFFLKIVVEKGQLLFLLQDNGKGCDSITPGFGLNNMKKSILNHGGQLEFNSVCGDGFEIKIMLPIQEV